MSGHSKWSQIKHKKGIADQRRGATFGKILTAISLAAREGTDPSMNSHLKTLLETARDQNIPAQNIERAINRAQKKDQAALVVLVLEAILSSGVGVIITAGTDNSNRTITQLRTLIHDLGGKLVGQGAVLWMFEQHQDSTSPTGTHYVPKQNLSLTPEQYTHTLTVIEKIRAHDDVQEVYHNAANL